MLQHRRIFLKIAKWKKPVKRPHVTLFYLCEMSRKDKSIEIENILITAKGEDCRVHLNEQMGSF